MDAGANYTGSAGNDTFTALDANVGAGLVNTFGAGDQINGGAGADTLVINTLVSGYTLPTTVYATGIETLSVTANGAGTTTTVDTSGFGYADLTSVTVSANSDGAGAGAGTAGVYLAATSAQSVTITNIAGSVVADGGSSQTVTAKGLVALSSSAGAVSVTNAAQGAGTITIDNGTSVSVTSTTSQSSLAGSAGTGGAVTIGAAVGGAPTGSVTVNETVKNSSTAFGYTGGAIGVTGGTSVAITQTASQALKATAGVNVTTTQGNVTVTGKSTTTAVTVTQSAAVTAADTVVGVTGVKEASTVTFSALTAGQTIILGGLTFTAGAAGATAAQVAAAFAGLSSGAISGAAKVSVGTFAGTLSGWATGAAGSDNSVTFTATTTGDKTDLANTGTGTASAVKLNDGVASATAAGKGGIAAGSVTVLDANYGAGAGTKKGTISTVTASNFNGLTISDNALTTLNLTGGATISSGNVTINNASALLDADLTKALTVNLTGVVGTITDAGVYKTVNVVVGSSAGTAGLSASGMTALNVSGSAGLKVSSISAAALKSVTVSGAAGISGSAGALDLSGIAALTSVDTTGATGTTSVKIDATTASYAGGAGVDSVTTSAGVSKVISLGDGNDTLTLAAGTSSLSNNISGGNGTDTLVMTATDADAADASAAFASYLSGFEILKLTGAGGAQAVDLSVLGFTNTVTVGTHSAAGTLTLSNLVSGGTVNIDTQNNVTGLDILSLTNAAWNAVGANSDSVNINIGGAAIATSNTYGTVNLNGVESVVLTATHASATAAGVAIAAGTYTETVAISDVSTTDVLSSLTINGNAAVSLDVTGADALRSINAAGNAGGVTVTAASLLSATITGGSGNDLLTAHAAASTLADTLIGGAGNDTLTSNSGLTTLTGGAGNDAFVIAAAGASKNIYTTITDLSVGDKIVLADLGTETFSATKVTLAAGVSESLTEYANAAASSATANVNAVIKWFQFGGDTYIVEDRSAATTFVDGTDIIVKVSGLVDLSNLALSGAAAGAPSLTLFG